jgi:excisionase family DNA binding protein
MDTPSLRKDGQPIIRKKPASPRQQFLTVQQVSAEKGWPESTVYRLIQRGQLPFVKLSDGNRRIWISRRDIEAFIESHTERMSVA